MYLHGDKCGHNFLGATENTTYSVVAVFPLFIPFSIFPFTCTYSLLLMNNITPPALDSRTVTRELTEQLSSCSKDQFLHAINVILKLEHAEDSEILRHGPKIIALTEVARSTLKRLDVELYLFIACSEALLPFKSAYFKLLLFLKCRKDAFPYDNRITRLLSPLYTRMVICCDGVDPRAQLGIKELPPPPTIPAAWMTTSQPATLADVSAAQQPNATSSDISMMPPPDAFTSKRQKIDRLGEFIKAQSAEKSHERGHPALMQYPAGNPRAQQVRMPKQYPAGNPVVQQARMPKQYPAGNPGEIQALMPKQYPAGNNGEPSRPPRALTRTHAQYF